MHAAFSTVIASAAVCQILVRLVFYFRNPVSAELCPLSADIVTFFPSTNECGWRCTSSSDSSRPKSVASTWRSESAFEKSKLSLSF